MSAIENILSRLDKVKSLGGGKYTALCPVHSEKTPSLSLRETDEGAVLIHCFGCGANGIDVVGATGLDASDLFPIDMSHGHARRERVPFPAHQILACLDFESQIILIASRKILDGEAITEADYLRVQLANNRIYNAKNYCK